ncbi:hypothetical protein XNA1_3180012 [Xenorhabdus nematophila str. Anatoliense]|nr:hypothetical protein XNA1_200011 [Xenorhabdus nematophila str. Anatoliense]CEE92911.1 hypothetical protein XNA1_3180012 [Xenorhabdus nematophila str. Anatoliense]
MINDCCNVQVFMCINTTDDALLNFSHRIKSLLANALASPDRYLGQDSKETSRQALLESRVPWGESPYSVFLSPTDQRQDTI